MRRLKRVGMILLLAILTTVPAATKNSKDKAKPLFLKGQDAEARQNYEAAYTFYKQAFDLKPKEVAYRLAYQRTKFLAAASHVHRGQLLREEGKLQEALAEFQVAKLIDAADPIVDQEVRRTQALIERQSRAPGQPPPAPANMSPLAAQAAGPVELAPISNLPITLKLSEDAKVVYETIGKLAGVNVLFDPDYTSRRIRIELNNVTLYEALQIVALESKTFWRPVTPNTIFIAADTKNKRTEIEQQVIRTFYLSNWSTPTDIQDATNTLRTLLELPRVQQLQSSGAIVVRGTADQIALAEKILNDIDKAKPEVVVEVAIMNVSRDKLRQLGIQMPFSSTSNPTITLQSTNPLSSTSTTSSTTTTGTTGTTSTSGLTLNDLANLNARNFAVSIPSTSVQFLLNDSKTKVIQQPQIRAVDGQKATLKIGQRVPVATGSFQPGIGGVGVNPLVNTQFNYIDVGVNVDMTPHIHANREVSMKMLFEISSVVSFQNIGGINQPVIGQDRIEQEIRLREGEVNLIGGLLENSYTDSMSGLPWLSQIPILKYLFGQSQTERIQNEILFVLTPHIVRSLDVTEFNTRAVNIGTANAIQVQRTQPVAVPVSTPAQPAPGAAQPGPQGGSTPGSTPPVGSAPALPPSGTLQTPPSGAGRPQAAVPAAATQQALATPPSGGTPSVAQRMGQMGAGPVISFDPAMINQKAGNTFAINVMLSGAQNVSSVPVQVAYDPNLLHLVNISNGDLLSKDGQPVALVHREDTKAGSIQMTASRPPSTPGVSGNGTVFTLTFLAVKSGQATLSVNRAVLRDAAMQSQNAAGSQAIISIQ
ncbi:MAG: cohesin domain-containing protein [Candidatus Korobacteraceae bacterium]